MKVLITGFEGFNNSSKILLDHFPNEIDKLYLKNSKMESVQQLLKEVQCYDTILAFGQKPCLKNKVSVEKQAALNGNIMLSHFDFESIKDFFAGKYPLRFSMNAGTSFCNHLYYYGLKELSSSEKKMVFIHIPMLQNIDNMDSLVDTLKSYIDSCL